MAAPHHVMSTKNMQFDQPVTNEIFVGQTVHQLSTERVVTTFEQSNDLDLFDLVCHVPHLSKVYNL